MIWAGAAFLRCEQMKYWIGSFRWNNGGNSVQSGWIQSFSSSFSPRIILTNQAKLILSKDNFMQISFNASCFSSFEYLVKKTTEALTSLKNTCSLCFHPTPVSSIQRIIYLDSGILYFYLCFSFIYLYTVYVYSIYTENIIHI